MSWPEFAIHQHNANVVCSETENGQYPGNCRMDVSIRKLNYFAKMGAMFLFDCCFGWDERYVYCCDSEELKEALERYCDVNVNGTRRYCFYFDFEHGFIYNLHRERILQVEPVANGEEYCLYRREMM